MRFDRSEFANFRQSGRARAGLSFLDANACRQIDSSSLLIRPKHNALRFSSGGDAPVSPLCLPQVTPVQLRAATSSLNHPADWLPPRAALRWNVVQLS